MSNETHDTRNCPVHQDQFVSAADTTAGEWDAKLAQAIILIDKPNAAIRDQLAQCQAACSRKDEALRRLRTSPSVLPMMSGEHLDSLQLVELLNSAISTQPDANALQQVVERETAKLREEHRDLIGLWNAVSKQLGVQDDEDYHNSPLQYVKEWQSRCEQLRTRAEAAERERDEAKAGAQKATSECGFLNNTIFNMGIEAKTLRAERDALAAQVEKMRTVLKELQTVLQPAANNRRFMQVANPARQSLNIIKDALAANAELGRTQG